MPRRRLYDLNSKFPKLPAIESQYMSKVPFVLSAVGHCSSGKSYTAVSLVRLMRREGSITHLYLISPTARSNTIYRNILMPEDKTSEDLSSGVFEVINNFVKDMESIADKYREDLEYAISYTKFVSGEPISAADEARLEQRMFERVTPRRPSFCLFIDDAQSSALFSSSRRNPLLNIVLRHRHLGSGLGCSVVFCAQTMRNGVPKCLRTNCTHWMLFGTHSKKELEAMYDEVAGFSGVHEFLAVFEDATATQHGYLFCDLIRKTLSDSF